MSVIQSEQKELRYLKRKGLEQESRIVGNALRDQIRQYGVDCHYFKMKTDEFANFKKIVDQNTILKRAYGYNITPDYTLSAHMITYAEMQSDIFLLNKIGVNPNSEIDFNFDKIDFACALAPKCGQLREYHIDENEVKCIVPDPNELSGAKKFQIGEKNVLPVYTCDVLSGWYRAVIDEYEYDKEYTISCDPYEHTDFNIEFPANSDLYRSLKYTIENIDYLETQIFLTYKVLKMPIGGKQHKNMLSGYVHGTILFYDVNEVGKYIELIHPSVGDIVQIDFPDGKDREMYEITECFDKQLTNDGINMLLHKYIWKCKARRYINSFENSSLPSSEYDARVLEKHQHETAADEYVAKKISMYDELSAGFTEDMAYGGMNNPSIEDAYDKNKVEVPVNNAPAVQDDGTWINLMSFHIGAKLQTDGYSLIFTSIDGASHVIAASKSEDQDISIPAQQNMRWLKATDSEILFVDIEGQYSRIAVTAAVKMPEIELNLNSLTNATSDNERQMNYDDQCFYKFKGTRSVMFTDGYSLYAKLAVDGNVYKVA